MLLDAMYEVPGSDIQTVIVTEDCVNGLKPPEFIRDSMPSTSTYQLPPKVSTNGSQITLKTSTRADKSELNIDGSAISSDEAESYSSLSSDEDAQKSAANINKDPPKSSTCTDKDAPNVSTSEGDATPNTSANIENTENILSTTSGETKDESFNKRFKSGVPTTSNT